MHTNALSTINPAAEVPTNEEAQNNANASTGDQTATSNLNASPSNNQATNSDTESVTQEISQPDADQQSAVPSLVPPNRVAGSQGGFNVSPEEYALIQEAKLLKHERRVEDKVKLHSKIFPSRRITVALRRIDDLRALATDEDVIAYIEVCNLKAVAGKKAEATEEEMSAYLQLFRQGQDPNLAAINNLLNKG